MISTPKADWVKPRGFVYTLYLYYVLYVNKWSLFLSIFWTDGGG